MLGSLVLFGGFVKNLLPSSKFFGIQFLMIRDKGSLSLQTISQDLSQQHKAA
jgi:hypothetical protein